MACRRPFCSIYKFLPWSLRLATLLAGRRREEEGYADHVTERISAGQQSNLHLWRGAFQPISFDPAVRRYRPKFKFCQSVIKERKGNVIHANLSEVSGQRAGSKFVCSGGTSRDTTTTKETFFCNFELTYILCCLHPLPPPSIFAVMKEDH